MLSRTLECEKYRLIDYAMLTKTQEGSMVELEPLNGHGLFA